MLTSESAYSSCLINVPGILLQFYFGYMVFFKLKIQKQNTTEQTIGKERINFRQTCMMHKEWLHSLHSCFGRPPAALCSVLSLAVVSERKCQKVHKGRQCKNPTTHHAKRYDVCNYSQGCLLLQFLWQNWYHQSEHKSLARFYT